MNPSVQEFLFDMLIIFAAGLAHVSYMLGIGVDPLPTVGIGIVIVGIGVVVLVPATGRASGAVIGVFGIVLAGAVVPRYAARAVRPDNTLELSLVLAGVILLLTVAVLRVTTFDARARQPVLD